MFPRMRIRRTGKRKIARKGETEQEQVRIPDLKKPMTPDTIHYLQSTVGNRATQAMIQRLPISATVIGAIGKPKADTKKKLNSTYYKAVLTALDQANAFLVNTVVGDTAAALQAEHKTYMGFLDGVYDAAQAYVNAKGGKGFRGRDDKKAKYIRGLFGQSARDRVIAGQTLNKLLRLPTFTGGRPKWNNALTGDVLDRQLALQLDERNRVGTRGGGINQVTEFNQGGTEGFFKKNTSQIQPAYTPEDELNLTEAAMEKGGTAVQDAMAEIMAVNANADVAEKAGIDLNDAHMAKRDVAMSRIDQLLGAGVIARAELATRDLGAGPEAGSFMEKAKGERAGDLDRQNKFAKDATDQATKGPGAINVEDPNLQRLMSRLQLVDIIAFQVDRHKGNFFLQVDGAGNVKGITGIDNDMSLGTKTDISKQVQEFPAMSEFVDAELAERIINLQPDDLRWALSDLLTPAEVEAAVTRLAKLQTHLEALKKKNKLLKPSQWTTATAQGLMKEGKSYYSKTFQWGV